MPQITVNDINIYYEIHGEDDGFPLVMIMGLAANSDWWGEELIDVLSKKFKVIIFDNRGAARTNNDRDFTMNDLAKDTVDLMDALDIKKANILGISLGGMIAQEFALNYPERVNKLVLCSTMCGGAKYVPPSKIVLDNLVKGRQGLTIEQFVKASIKILFTNNFIKNNPDKIEETIQVVLKHPISEETYQRQLKAVLGFNASRRLKTIKIPTLVMHGKKDILIPCQNGENIAKLIPESKLVLFENSAHALFSEESDIVTTELTNFLD
jgi:pimeloyl-ACP methyl ester carboxylesterase